MNLLWGVDQFLIEREEHFSQMLKTANDFLINEKKYNKGDKIKVKVLEIKKEEQKIRVGLKQTQTDPFDWFKSKKVNDTITVQVISSDSKGLIVKPEGSDLQFSIKKSQIAVSAADARPSRFAKGDKVDAMITELDKEKRKIHIS